MAQMGLTPNRSLTDNNGVGVQHSAAVASPTLASADAQKATIASPTLAPDASSAAGPALGQANTFNLAPTSKSATSTSATPQISRPNNKNTPMVASNPQPRLSRQQGAHTSSTPQSKTSSFTSPPSASSPQTKATQSPKK